MCWCLLLFEICVGVLMGSMNFSTCVFRCVIFVFLPVCFMLVCNMCWCFGVKYVFVSNMCEICVVV